jgi:hypothetical protein
MGLKSITHKSHDELFFGARAHWTQGLAETANQET